MFGSRQFSAYYVNDVSRGVDRKFLL